MIPESNHMGKGKNNVQCIVGGFVALRVDVAQDFSPVSR